MLAILPSRAARETKGAYRKGEIGSAHAAYEEEEEGNARREKHEAFLSARRTIVRV